MPVHRTIARLVVAIAIPILACAVQLLLWEHLNPYGWILFYPAVFFSSWLGGRFCGIVATALSVVLAMYFFTPPGSLGIQDPNSIRAAIVFAAMGLLFTFTHDRLHRMTGLAETALADTCALNEQLQKANVELEQSYRRTLQTTERDAQERIRLAMEAIHAGLWDWNVLTGQIIVDERWEGIVGYEPGEMGDYNWEKWQALCHPDDLAKSTKAIDECLNDDNPFYECECRIRHRDGHWVWVMDRGKVTQRDACGKPLRMVGAHIDITWQKHAEEQLRLSHERYVNFISQCHEAIYCFELDEPIDLSLPVEEQVDLMYAHGWLSECNQAMANIYGIESAESLVGKRLVDFHGGSDNPFNRQACAQLVRAGFRCDNIETIETTVSGETRWFLNNATGTVDAGKVSRIWGTALDITERKRAETALRESEQQFRMLFKGLCVGALEYDPDTLRVKLFNDLAAESLGYTPREFSGFRLTDLQPHLSETQIRASIRGAMDSGAEFQFETQIHTKAGMPLDVVVNRQKLYQDGKLSILITWLDITQRKRAEEALRASETELRKAQKTANLGSWTWYVPTNTGVWSDQMCQIFGVSQEEVEQNFPNILAKAVHPDDWDFVKEVMRLAIRKKILQPVEYRIRRQDGTERVIWSETSDLVLDDAGNVITASGILQDITERRQAELQLQESEKRLQLIMSAGNVGLWECDFRNNSAWYSREWKILLGYSDDEIDYTITGWREMVHPNDFPAIDKAFERFLEDPNFHYEVQFRMRHKNGSYRWFLAQATGICEDGMPVRMVGSHVDITHHKQIEDALRESERRYTVTMEALNDGLWDWHVPTGTAYLSERAYAILGYENKAFEPTYDAWRMLVHPNDLVSAELEMNRGAKEGPGFSTDFRIRKANGDWLWVCLRGKPTEFDEQGNLARLVGTLTDISARKRAEEAERFTEKRYRDLVEANFDWVWEIDTNARYTYVSPRVFDLLGYMPEEILGKTPFDIMPEQEALRTAAKFDEFARDRRPIEAMENANRHKDGGTIILETSAVPILGANDEFLGYRGVDRDVTVRHELEERLRQSQKMEAVGQLAGGVAHDFNNLLQIILGYTDMAMAELGGKSAARESMAEVRIAAERAATLVSQLLAFSRRQIMRPEPLEIDNVVANLLKMLRRVIGEHIHLMFEPGVAPGRILADRGMLEQVLINLCVNARDAMGTSGMLKIATEMIEADNEFCAANPGTVPGRFIVLRVSDTGCGMTDETIQHIFEPFFTTKEVGHGTGLGLSTVYGIVRQHGGTVRVKSAPGQGSEFCVYLPETTMARDVVHSPVDEFSVGGTETILLAEDEDGVRKLMTQVLERAGYRVLGAKDGVEAVGMFHQHAHEIDLLLLDVVMPKLGGRSVAETVQRLRPQIPALFASGYNDDAIHSNFVLQEGMTLIQKPCKPQELLRYVRDALNKRGVTN